MWYGVEGENKKKNQSKEDESSLKRQATRLVSSDNKQFCLRQRTRSQNYMSYNHQ